MQYKQLKVKIYFFKRNILQYAQKTLKDSSTVSSSIQRKILDFNLQNELICSMICKR